jgi:type VI secretion system FHA domain protein
VSYLLLFTGPAFEQAVTLAPGGATVLVGRDTEATVHLPDTERLISRRHLAIQWSAGGVRIQVLSPNGMATDRGDFFAGDEVVLADGESARVGAFSLRITAVAAAVDPDATDPSGAGLRPGADAPAAAAADPWAELAAQWSPTQAPPAPARSPVQRTMDDPFSSSTSWRIEDLGAFSSTGSFASPDTPTQPGVRAALPASGASTPERLALQSLARGLGMDVPSGPTGFDWERFGMAIRQVVQCLGEHLATRADAKRDLRAEDSTMLGGQAKNPLRGAMPIHELLHYLLFMPEGAGGYVPARRALEEMSEEARAHEAASRAAARALAEGAIKEFDPEKLRALLLKGKLSIASLRLWDLYTSHYQDRADQLPGWAEELFNRHYMAAYLREAERLRRLAPAKSVDRGIAGKA